MLTTGYRCRRAIDRYLWNEGKGMYFDYDTVKKEQTDYESATTFWAMWAGLASPHQAAALVVKALPRFEAFGGLVSGTEESRGPISIERFVYELQDKLREHKRFLLPTRSPALRRNADFRLCIALAASGITLMVSIRLTP